MNKSFTILEVIAAIFVMTVGVLSAYAIVQQIIIYNSISSSRLAAAYLAMEGIEEVRNIRDTNWLEGEAWDSGIGSSNWIAHSMLPKYERKTTITPEGADKLKVLVEIRWTEKGQTHTVTAEEHLYNWY